MTRARDTTDMPELLLLGGTIAREWRRRHPNGLVWITYAHDAQEPIG